MQTSSVRGAGRRACAAAAVGLALLGAALHRAAAREPPAVSVVSVTLPAATSVTIPPRVPAPGHAAPRVLLLHTYGPSRAVGPVFDNVFLDALQQLVPETDLSSETMETERAWPEGQPVTFRRYLQSKYTGREPDLIVAVGDAALVMARLVQPVLGNPRLLGISYTAGQFRPGDARVSGIEARLGYGDTMKLAWALRPGTREVIVVDGMLSSHGRIEAEVRDELGHLPVHVTYLRDRPLDEVVSAVRAAPEHAVVLFVRQRMLEAGRDVNPLVALRRVVQASAVPVFSVNGLHIGHGVVGGSVWDFETLGRRAAAMSAQLLSDAAPQALPLESVAHVPVVDWRQLQRWELAAQPLPPGTRQLFKPPSDWLAYRQFVVAGLVIFLVQCGLIGGLVVERVWRRRAEKKANHLRAELAHVARVAAMGELVASMAHELAQPLTGILSNAQAAERLLAGNRLTTTTLKDILGDIVDDDRRAVEVIGRVRELACKHVARHEQVDMEEVIQRVVKLLASDTFIRGAVIDVRVADQQLFVAGDRVQLQQLLMNLLLNALDAVATATPGDQRIAVAAHAPDLYTVEVSVRDNGPGLAPEVRPRIFEPFYTTKETGMGMGLSIARSVVEAHRGRLWAVETGHGGAEFRFTLPRDEAAA